jgi:peptidoglycan pentaglycine glycine transferase (the first glycine)
MPLTIENITDQEQWQSLLRDLPDAHILQTWLWGDFKERTTGWVAHRWAIYDEHDTLVALISMGIRKLGGIIPVMYAPKAPVFVRYDASLFTQVLDLLENEAKRRRALWLKIDPEIIRATGEPDSDDDEVNEAGMAFEGVLKRRGWQFSDEQVQFRNTVNVDLSPSEDDLLIAMSQNTRRKVRQASKKGVVVRAGTLDDLDMLYDLYAETGARDGFLIRPRDYYVTLWREMMQAGMGHSLIAEYEGKPIAHVILFHVGRKCWYFYGASRDKERQRMPNYALQWEAIRWAKAQGYTIYDMWGAPDAFDESDGMWGVYQFKRGFRGTVTRHVGAWDYTPMPLLYTLFTRALPFIRQTLRRIKR